MTAYLDTHAILLGALLLGVWTVVALVIGLLLGAVMRQTDETDETWLDAQPNSRTDTQEIYLPREWVL